MYLFCVIPVALKYLPIGCFKDRIKKSKPRLLPNLIKNFRGNIDWYNHNKTIDACAEEARKNGTLYFAIQFYGECWTGPMAHLTFDQAGPSNNCISGVGGARTNFVYMLTGKGKCPQRRGGERRGEGGIQIYK